MTKSKLRWGILGVAQINERLLPAFAKAANTELRAIASRSAERARKAAADAGIPVAHGSYEALLDDPTIDAVYNPLPNTLHAEWTMKSAERGKHVLCEKPLSPTAAEAQKVVEFCKAKKVKLMDGFMWPHHPRTAKIRQLLDRGDIGAIRRVTSAFSFQLPPNPANIRLKPDMAGGSLLDVGCYPVFGIRWAFGAEPVRVYATATYQFGVDVQMSAILWLADGRTASFDCAFTLSFRQWLEIVGSEATICVPDMWLPGQQAGFTIEREAKAPEKIVIEGEDQIVHMLQDFERAVRQDEPVRPAPEEAVKTLRVLDALAKSAREGRVVEV